jgi:hypothetical protein
MEPLKMGFPSEFLRDPHVLGCGMTTDLGIRACPSTAYRLRRQLVKELVRYLLDNLYVDFQGEISLDQVRQFLRGDDSREAKQLLQKLIEDKGVDDLLITLADVLKEHVRTGVNDQVMKEQLVMYAES